MCFFEGNVKNTGLGKCFTPSSRGEKCPSSLQKQPPNWGILSRNEGMEEVKRMVERWEHDNHMQINVDYPYTESIEQIQQDTI